MTKRTFYILTIIFIALYVVFVVFVLSINAGLFRSGTSDHSIIVEGHYYLCNFFDYISNGKSLGDVFFALGCFLLCDLPVIATVVSIILVITKHYLSNIIICSIINVEFIALSIIFHSFYPYPGSFLWLLLLPLSIMAFIFQNKALHRLEHDEDLSINK